MFDDVEIITNAYTSLHFINVFDDIEEDYDGCIFNNNIYKFLF